VLIRIFCHNYWPDNLVTSTRIGQMASIWRSTDPTLEIEVVCTRPFYPTGVLRDEDRFRLLRRETIDGVKVVRVWSVAAPNWGVLRRSLSFVTYFISAVLYGLFARRSDVVIGSSPQLLAATAAAVVARLRRIPCVIEARDLWPDSIDVVYAGRKAWLSRPLKLLSHMTYGSAELLATVSRSFDRHLTPYLRKGARFLFVPNAYLFKGNEDSAATELPPTGSRPLIFGYAGNLGMAQGLDTVIEATRILLDEGRPTASFRVLLAGTGADRQRLEELIRIRGVDSCVSLVNPVPYERVHEIYCQIDVSLILLKPSSVFEVTIPSKLFECMAYRKPILLGVKGEALRILDDAQAGYGFPPGDEAALARLMGEVIDGRRPLRGLGDRGASYVHEQFDRRRIAREYLQEIRKIATPERSWRAVGADPL
jgi:glycosyltransferase involved in cell wall biosynthesis